MTARRIVLLSAVLLLCGCGESAPDAGPPDAAMADAAIGDAAPVDAGRDTGTPTPLDAGPRLDASPSDAGPGDEMHPVFVAQGDLGRTVFSCDDGRTWVADASFDEASRCGGELDCTHHAGTAIGIAIGDGYVFASWGWGPPGHIARSAGPADGWESMLEGRVGRALFGAGVVVLGGVVFQRSTDLAVAFSEPVWTGLLRDNVRRAAFVPTAGGLFVMVADGGGEPGGPVRDLVVSSDGLDWRRASVFPESCGQELFYGGGIAGSPTTLVLLGGMGTVCTSSDGGDTWSSQRVTEAETSSVVFDGSGFSFWTRGTRHRSGDGLTWSSEPSGLDDHLGVVARHPSTGTLVGTSESSAYEDQAVYRSADGTTWERLSAAAFPPGHALRYIEGGLLSPSACADAGS